ncbi:MULTISPECIES: protein disulfide oxidoreductase [Vibrio]|uniref:protein disulfide oxidoreductase n=1 Tax=Vibrio TaxID=662 RepID=UPI002075CA20|nr:MULTISPECIES: protein disulfide oxidoreductase [Vibrio]USD34405.1 protein disulfide oxidoreductase [Vibrio sp. SCSIO 43186]USD47476.1 protein disulfide oxidoreductase [Vibrio sp. SCSIO 43145]USD71530.1 protein disulfide oxidoreductase [Vibrio sp. SCSIO 43139]USD98439.1 protein disulfide oxidoreductase [Vibrio coralliilyticus]
MKRSVRYWLKEVLILVVLGIAITSAMDWFRSQSLPTESAPPIMGRTMDDQFVDVIAMSYEEPVVVYFWATWCPACKFVSPTVDWLSQYYPVVGVAGSSGPSERVKQFMQAKDYQFSNINDQKGEIFNRWNISVTPSIFIVKEGKVESITTGITTPPGMLARLWLNQ